MNQMLIKRLMRVMVVVSMFTGLVTAQSGREYRRTAIMNGNQVRAVFGNWGVIGQPSNLGHRGAWQYDNNGYLGDVSPLVGAEVRFDSLTFHSVVTSPVDRPTQLTDVDPATGKFWTFEPVGGYLNASQQSIAMSNDEASWPTFWPDKAGDAADPGWMGSWNGYFGKKISADQESYFVMDDNNDERFNKANNNALRIAFKPDTTNLARNGLGLEVRVRGLQWAQFLAKDNIFWLYEIKNAGTTTYDRAVFGMLVGTYVGVTSTENYQEYSDDWSFYSPQDNITYTGDYGRRITNPLWVGNVGMVGYAFLESPGNPFDGIDNDGDADSTIAGSASPKFVSTSFDSTTVTTGQQLVLIRNDFSRVLFTVPSVDSFKIITRGMRDSMWIYPGRTRLAEGNILQRTITDPVYGVIRVDYVNTNSYDGIDNNFNGVIDENYYLHFRQLKKNRNPVGPPLIDIPNQLHYSDYRSGLGVAGTSMIDERRDDLVDNNGDWRLDKDDVGRDGVPETQDQGEGDGVPTSGYLFGGLDTGLPGEPRIDKTDVTESDQIGLTSFFYFAPSNQVRLGDDEALWSNLSPGFFDVPSSIQNNQPMGGEDGDFIYGSGYFPLLAQKTERFSLALVYGGGQGGSIQADIADLLRNKKTVQIIYDRNYTFTKAPDRPTLTAVAGDRKVTLYWDRKSEESVEEFFGEKIFEGYKLLKSTLPDFQDLLTITDGLGRSNGYRPLAQYDLIDSISGFFLPNAEQYQDLFGFAYYLGDETGLKHSYVDVDVQNGRTYYYALIAYSKGDSAKGRIPSENDFAVTIDQSGKVTKVPKNSAVVVPNAPVSGYVDAPSAVPLTKSIGTKGTGSIQFNVLNPEQVTGHAYQVEFFDTHTDGVDNNGNGKIDLQDSTEGIRTTTAFSVRDLETITSEFASQDTTRVLLGYAHLVPGTVTVLNASGGVVPSTAYVLDYERGAIQGDSTGTLPEGQYTIRFQYYPVYNSQNIQRNPAIIENIDSDNFDGVELLFENDWTTIPSAASRWGGTDAYSFSFAPIYSEFTFPVQLLVRGIRKPSDYRIEWANGIVDTAMQYDPGFLAETPVNFRIFNETDSAYIKFIFFDNDGNGIVTHLDELWFYEKDLSNRFQLTWDVQFIGKLVGGVSDTTTKYLKSGDTLFLRTLKPFRKGDVLTFTTMKPTTSESSMVAELSNIRVVPNPYVTASIFEPPLPPSIKSGRGTRKIDFTHIPPGATVSIYTSRGDHIITLRHDSNIQDGTVSWNLKTKENLDIAFGVYFYVVESSVGTKTGKFAIIK